MGLTSVLSSPLRVTFGHCAALIKCDDLSLRQSLAKHVRHRPEDTVPIVVTYRMAVKAKGNFYLWRDEKLFYSAPSASHIVEHLMQDLTVSLTTHSHQQLVLHAAALAHGKNGLILCGQSGSGKSTLAAWLTASGFDYLTDELVALPLEQPKMYGLVRSIMLKKGSAFVWKRWLDEATRQKLTNFPSGAVGLEPELLRSGHIRPTACPKILLFPRYIPNTPLTTQPLPPAEAAFHLMQHLINAKNLPNWGLTAITHLARQTTAYSLRYSDIEQATTWIKKIAADQLPA